MRFLRLFLNGSRKVRTVPPDPGDAASEAHQDVEDDCTIGGATGATEDDSLGASVQRKNTVAGGASAAKWEEGDDHNEKYPTVDGTGKRWNWTGTWSWSEKGGRASRANSEQR